MAVSECDGPGLLEAFRAAVANLERHVEEVNELNVFPVPDGDTGSNMLATVRGALREAEDVAEQTSGRIAAAIGFGALMGARGNSGVIMSQIFRGMAESLSGKERFNGLDLAQALSLGATSAYGAVGKPVEGTMLTVIRDAAAAAVSAAERDTGIETVLAATVDAAEQSVARTPTLLAILRESGVVDSGGQGLYRLFQGALLHLLGQAPTVASTQAATRVPTLAPPLDEGYGYETMFLLQADEERLLDIEAIRAHLESIGESVLVAGDARAVKVHVHNERPDLVIGYGLTLGSLSRISVENLDDQARDVRETRAAEFTASVDATNGSSGPSGTAPGVPAGEGGASGEPQPSLAVVAVAPGEGLAKIFLDDFGVASVIRGGQSANPSTGELLEAVRAVRAKEILLLPNNSNVVLAARQVADMTTDRRVVVVPTRNAAEGYAALLALDPGRDAISNAEPMTRRSREIQTMAVTEAVRDATIGGRRVRRGHTIVLDPDGGLIAADEDRDQAVLAAFRTLEPGIELVTIFYGEGAVLDEVEAVSRKIADALPGIEIEIFHGGQPFYRYLISAE